MQNKRFSSHFRIIMRMNHIWFSEMLGIIVVAFIISALVALGVTVLANHFSIRKNSAFLAQSAQDHYTISQTLDELREKNRIAYVLDSFSLGKLSSKTLWMLVDLVYKNSNTFGYDPFLVLAVIHVESFFDPVAKGQYRDGRYSGALGLMQLKPETAREVAEALGIPFNGTADLFFPEINIPLGVAYLTQQISQFKNLKLGILAYNQGPGAIINTIKKNQPLSIQYYNKVLKSYFRLKQMSSEAGYEDPEE